MFMVLLCVTSHALVCAQDELVVFDHDDMKSLFLLHKKCEQFMREGDMCYPMSFDAIKTMYFRGKLDDPHDVWPRVTDEIKGVFFGEKFVHRSIEDLRKKETCAEIIEDSKQRLARTKSVCQAEYDFEKIARDFFNKNKHKFTGWCKEFEDLYTLPNDFLPEHMVEERAFLRILLYLHLADIDKEKESWIFGQDKPRSLSNAQSEAICDYLMHQQHYAFVVLKTPFFALVDFFVACVDDKELFVLPESLDDLPYFSVHGGRWQGLLEIFFHDQKHTFSLCKNALALNSVRVGLHKKLAQGFLDSMRDYWETDGLCRLVLGFNWMHEEYYHTGLIAHQGTLRYALQKYLREIFDGGDEGLLVYTKHLFGWDDARVSAYQQRNKLQELTWTYITQILGEDLEIDVGCQQTQVINTLRKAWSVPEDLSNDMAGYQVLLMKIVERIFALDQYPDDVRQVVLRCISSSCPNQKGFFCILDGMLVLDHSDRLDKYVSWDLLLPDQLDKITQLQRRALLMQFLLSKVLYLKKIKNFSISWHIFQIVPWDNDFMHKLYSHCQQCVERTAMFVHYIPEQKFNPWV